MLAVICRDFNGIESLRLEEILKPEVQPGELLVKIAAAGVGFPDLLIAQGKYHFRPATPFTLGGEFAGTVVEVGEGVREFKPGDRIAGFVQTGTFAEYASVPATRSILIPENISFENAAAFGLNYSTAYAGLEASANIQAGETLLVLGAAGGVGLAAVDLGTAVGAKVIACASSEEKLDACRKYMPLATINTSLDDFRQKIREITGDSGIDVVLDPVGGNLSEPAFRSLKWRGRHVVIGFAAGDIPRLPLNLPLLKGASVSGISVGHFAQMEPQNFAAGTRRLVSMLASGAISPFVGLTYPLAEYAKALEKLADRTAIGKLVLRIS